jgi:hypothetical protein
VLFAEAIRGVGGKARVVLYEGEVHAFFHPGKTMALPTLYEMKRHIQQVWNFQKIAGIRLQNAEIRENWKIFSMVGSGCCRLVYGKRY